MIQFQYLQLVCSYFLFLPGSVLGDCTILRIYPFHRRPGFVPQVVNIPWKRERLPTRVFWPGEFHGLYSPSVTKSRTRLSNFHFHFTFQAIHFRSNSQNLTWNNRLVQNRERSTTRLILSPCLFNLYAECIMRNAMLVNHKLESRLPEGTSTTSGMKMHACMLSLSSLLRLFPCDAMDYSPPGFSVHGILQARILEQVVVPSFR